MSVLIGELNPWTFIISDTLGFIYLNYYFSVSAFMRFQVS